MRLKQKVIGILLVATLIAPAFTQQALAASGVIYITPASGSLQVGSSETLSLRINPGTTVDGVQATVSYNTSYLQLNSVDNSTSPFSTQLQKSAGGGTITLALGNLSGGVSSDSLIAYMNFTALAGSGSSNLVISNANATSNGSYTNPAVANATVSFTAPPAASPVPSGSSSNSSSGSSVRTYAARISSPSPATPTVASAAGTTATPAAAAKLDSKLTAVGYTSAHLTITSNQSLILYALYGTDSKNLTDKTVVSSPATRADPTIGNGGTLTPGTTYYYQVIGEDVSGAQTKLSVQHFTTAGFTVRVTVLGVNNRLLANSKVTLHSRAQTVTTDGNGVATFTDVAPGVHHLEYQANGHNYSSVVYVENDLAKVVKDKVATPSVQVAAVVLPVGPAAHSSVWLVTAATMAGILAAFGLFFEASRGRFHNTHLAIRLAHAGRALFL